MARYTRRGIGIAGSGRFSVDTLPEFLHFIGVALHALCLNGFCRLAYLMRIAMA
jgi:hypothetical protein